MDKNKTAYKLLQQLSDGSFHSGQEIACRLGVTRSAIWKAIRQIEALGIEIHAVSGRGYQLPGGLELLDKTLLLAQLAPSAAARLDDCEILLSTTSTNDYLLNLARQTPKKTIACVAEYQTQGRGRHGRSWESSFAGGCCLSLLWHFEKDLSQMRGLSLAIGVAVVNALQQYGIHHGIQLKWPNDVLWQGSKLAGILIEMLAEPHGNCSVVTGLGMNIQIPINVESSFKKGRIDIGNIAPGRPQRNRLIGLMLDAMINAVEKFECHGLAAFLTDWQQHDAMTGKPVVVITAQQKINGIMQGISDIGELMITTDDGRTHYFIQGEVSLRVGEV